MNELRAMNLLSRLRARGFYFFVYQSGQFDTEPAWQLTEEDLEAIEALLPAIVALVRGGFIGEFNEPNPHEDPDLARYYQSLDVVERMGFQDGARAGAEMTGLSFRDCQRYLYRIATGQGGFQ